MQPGQIGIEIVRSPPGADVKTDHVVGTTPMTLPLAPGVQATLTVDEAGLPAGHAHGARRAGRAAAVRARAGHGVQRHVAHEERRAALVRAHGRSGRASTSSPRSPDRREFFKNYKFAPADKGIAFAADDEVVDPRKPDDPRCHVPVHVEYRYDPQEDVLEQRREKVKIDFDRRQLRRALSAMSRATCSSTSIARTTKSRSPAPRRCALRDQP